MRIAVTRPIVLALAPEGLLWRIVVVVLGTALLAVAARVEIPLPFSPVPVTGQTFAVLVIGASLGARLGTLTRPAQGQRVRTTPKYSSALPDTPSSSASMPHLLATYRDTKQLSGGAPARDDRPARTV